MNDFRHPVAPWYPVATAPVNATSGLTPNVLLDLARPLLDAVVRVRRMGATEPPALREELMREVRAFQSRAQAAGLAPETIVAARYCLCTVLDEAAALTTWGRGGMWSSAGLLVAFHGETWGGEKFFQLLARLSAQPHRHVDLIELQYVCLALGFQGRYHVMQDGTVKLDALRHRLYRMIAPLRPAVPAALSPHWRASDATAAQRVSGGIPPWVTIAAFALSALLFLIGFRYAIDVRSSRVEDAFATLRLPEMASPTPDDIERWLAPDIAANVLTVHRSGDHTRIALRGDGAFASGATTVESSYLPTLARIATALNHFPGDLIITGHTDDQPVRTKAFSSNTQLSLARAESVKRALGDVGLVAYSSISTEGAGDAEPIALNDTPAGRARNRRVDIVLIAPQSGVTSYPLVDPS